MSKPFDPTKPVQTRNGSKARIVPADRRHPSHPICALVLYADGTEGVYFYEPDGCSCGPEKSLFDLVNIPERIQWEGWVNLYDNSKMSPSFLYRSKQEADQYASNGRLACVKITIDCAEGEGL